MAPKPEQIAQQGELVQVTAPDPNMVAFMAHLSEQGIQPADVVIPVVPFFWKVSWDELCNLRTQDPKTMCSPIVCVRNFVEMPEQSGEFPDYSGMMRIEFTTQDKQDLFITTSMCYSATGEWLPLSGWVRTQVTPFLMRFGYIETRKVGRHVVRALPVNIPLP